MNPKNWKEMVERSRELEAALGNGEKKIEENESQTVIVQRRAINAAVDIPRGEIIKQKDLIMLRPCPIDAIPPSRENEVVGKIANESIKKGSYIKWSELN